MHGQQNIKIMCHSKFGAQVGCVRTCLYVCGLNNSPPCTDESLW